MSEAVQTIPKIHGLISKVMGDVGAIGKTGENEVDGYKFRKIDDVYNKLQPILAKHSVFFVPSISSSSEEKILTEDGSSRVRVKLTVKYRIFADDGSFIDAVTQGEAIDQSDKATNKALTAAFKYLLIQVFCIAIEGQPDADDSSPKLTFANEKTPAKKKADFKIGDGKYRGQLVSEIPPAELNSYLRKMEKAIKGEGRNPPKWFAELKKAAGA
jgi:hypothetical protein